MLNVPPVHFIRVTVREMEQKYVSNNMENVWMSQRKQRQ